ncbi:glycosyltransferase family 2 protein [Paenibacillus physcomitrellae]|uniref:Glycosyltransferase YkoT n=1 Tax=Paenibacillus physcomitrellae TaxID=1619311 RepID=A0ABQ1FMG9_9BACL|nr:glycosyltransferase family 2 protein [Paenibacillus physcomitrellae]GGA19871.1 putative glycosyltransferase YkoT [Paenibacillus physcomitrellae]
MNRERPKLGIVVPCYNEEPVIEETVRQLSDVLTSLMREELIAQDSFLLFVNDGSADRTWDLIERLHDRYPWVSGLKLAANVGHQNALLAGLMQAKDRCDCTISIDADLQDDVRVIRDFVLKYREGYEIVYGVRRKRDTDTWFKRNSALGFYKLMKSMGLKVVYNHADYRLLSRTALEHLSRFREVNLFLRGLVPLIGLKSTEVYYDRLERFAGESKYPLKKMINFALEGITSLSVEPIRFVTGSGFLCFGISLIVGIYALVSKLMGNTVSGWTSLMLSVWFIGGMVLISLGLIGEYVGKIYKEVKSRPLYLIERDLPAQNALEAGTGASAPHPAIDQVVRYER